MPKRNSKVLTDAAIQRFATPSKGQRAERFDRLTPGLALRITDTGTRSWIVYYYHAGQHRKETIGRYPMMSVADARTRAGEIKQINHAGIDPRLHDERQRQARIEEERKVQVNTFGYVVDQFMKERGDQLRKAKDLRRQLNKDLLPSFGERPIKEITRAEIKTVIWTKAKTAPHGAGNILNIVRRVFNYALDEGYIDASPCHKIRPPVATVERDRVLTDDEVRVIWNACDQIGLPPWGQIVRLLFLTGCRRSEIMELHVSEIDLNDRMIVIPASRYKTKREHAVPLSDLALEQLPSPLPDGFVFTAPRSYTGKPFSSQTPAMRALRVESDVHDWCVHDSRRTVETNLAKLRFSKEIRDRVLGHTPGDLQRRYNRWDYMPEKRAALDAWANRVLDIVNGTTSTVIPFAS